MITAFNCIIIALVLLIAYWWASQGVFSALLHLVCVIAAAGVAFGTWEMLALQMLQRGWLENYAWGVALLLPFAIYLLIMRIAADKIVANNVNFPQWANFVFGGGFGLVSGVLTIGMCLLGGGLLQGSNDLMGFRGSYRSAEAHGQPDFDHEKLWFPVHKITAATFGWMGSRSLAPEQGRSMLAAYPKLADQSFSLHRDAAENGRARTAAPPGSVKFGNFYYSPECVNAGTGSRGAYVIEVDVDSTASDSGGVVTITGAQIRMIQDLAPSSAQEAEVVYPSEWSQPSESGFRQIWPFDDITASATNVPGQQSTKFYFFFPAGKLGSPEGGLPPRYLQFKGLRLRLPALDPMRPSDAEIRNIARGAAAVNVDVPINDPTKKSVAGKDITVNSSISPGVVSINELTTMEQTDQLLTEGRQEFNRGGNQPSQANRIKGIYVQDGTAMVRLNISRKLSSIDLWNDRNKVREKAGEQATLYLVDSNGNQYQPMGYVWIKSDGVVISLDPKRGVPTIADFPNQPSSGSNELYALFTPTAKVKIVSIRLGSEIVANADFEVIPESK